MQDQKQPTVIFEDEVMLVANKPAGMTVNVSDTTAKEVTVQDWAEEKLHIANGVWQIEEGNDFVKRGGIVHRLDKETSGILLIAKTPEAFVELQRQFKERLVEKQYRALAHGRVLPVTGEIRVPVGRLPWNRKQFGIVAGGREAVTRYKTLAYGLWHMANGSDEVLTLLELHPETGRTHQIRVHLKYIGHPIFADFLYAGRKTARDDRNHLSRVFLHAAGISFSHPTTGERVQFEATLAEDLSRFLDSLEKVD